MNAERLLAHYAEIAEAPDAVPRLRRLVLELAVRGKLVSQDSKEEPASELMKRMAREKARQFAAGEIRKPKPAKPISPSEHPCSLPEPGWAWARLNELGRIAGGMTPSMGRSEYWGGSISWLSPKDIKADEVIESELKITEVGLRETRLEAYPEGCLFIVARSGILKRKLPVSINRAPAAANQDMKVLVPLLAGMERYLQVMLRGFESFILTDLVKTGTTVQSLKYDEFEGQPFPIPPFGEQHRIVAKVDELMALCDELEAARTAREAARDRLAAVSLARLNTPNPETFQADARFALDALPALTTRPDQINRFRKAIMNLAVRGRLVSQSSTEEPAPVEDDATGPDGRLELAIPPNWRWARVEDVATTRLGKMLDKEKNRGRPFPYLGNTNVHWFDIRSSNLKTILLDDRELAEYRLEQGDVLICEGGHGIARTAVWRGSQEDVVFQKALHRVRPGPHLDPDFFAYCCLVYFEAGVTATYFTGVGIPHFTGKALAKLAFPLPPIAEQHRIVARVDELMALCDELEVSLDTADTTRRRLLEALLAEALTPALEEAA